MIDQYVTLISSLPPHMPNLFKAKQTPISRIQLDQRLQMLQPQHANDLALIENLVHWDRLAISTTDTEMLMREEETLKHLENAFIKQIIVWRLEERTAIAALRRKHAGFDVPESSEPWGFGRWVRHIERHWDEPAFGLAKIIPWLADAERQVQNKNYLALERLLLSLVWNYYGRVAEGHYFDFEAVVIYVLRWDVIDRWSRYNSDAARQRLIGLVESGQGEGILFTFKNTPL